MVEILKLDCFLKICPTLWPEFLGSVATFKKVAGCINKQSECGNVTENVVNYNIDKNVIDFLPTSYPPMDYWLKNT